MLTNKLHVLFIFVLVALTSCDARIIDVPLQKETAMNVYTNQLRDVHGSQVNNELFQGKVTLIVNLASKCGYTPQYKDLQALHEQYASQGFSVVGFPCNDFGGQEPGDAAAITACASEYGATFPIMEKVSVLDNDAQCAMYHDLKEATGVLPKWNFGKYLVNQHGTPVAFFGSDIEPLSAALTARIDELLTLPH